MDQREHNWSVKHVNCPRISRRAWAVWIAILVLLIASPWLWNEILAGHSEPPWKGGTVTQGGLSRRAGTTKERTPTTPVWRVILFEQLPAYACVLTPLLQFPPAQRAAVFRRHNHRYDSEMHQRNLIDDA